MNQKYVLYTVYFFAVVLFGQCPPPSHNSCNSWILHTVYLSARVLLIWVREYLVEESDCRSNSAILCKNVHLTPLRIPLLTRLNGLDERGLNTKRPTLVFFLPPHMDRQARTGDSRGLTGMSQTLPRWLGEKRAKTTENKIYWSLAYPLPCL